jgi:hypothetical protein
MAAACSSAAIAQTQEQPVGSYGMQHIFGEVLERQVNAEVHVSF